MWPFLIVCVTVAEHQPASLPHFNPLTWPNSTNVTKDFRWMIAGLSWLSNVSALANRTSWRRVYGSLLELVLALLALLALLSDTARLRLSIQHLRGSVETTHDSSREVSCTKNIFAWTRLGSKGVRPHSLGRFV